MNMSNKTYDVLKFIATIVLPAFGAFYLTIAGTWGLPYGEAIVATTSAVSTFMAAVLMIDSKAYHNNITAAQENLTDNKGE